MGNSITIKKFINKRDVKIGGTLFSGNRSDMTIMNMIQSTYPMSFSENFFNENILLRRITGIPPITYEWWGWDTK